MTDRPVNPELHIYPDGRPVPPFLTPTEVAAWFGLSRGAVYNAIARGDLYCRKFTKRAYIIPRDAALRWFYEGEQG